MLFLPMHEVFADTTIVLADVSALPTEQLHTDVHNAELLLL